MSLIRFYTPIFVYFLFIFACSSDDSTTPNANNVECSEEVNFKEDGEEVTLPLVLPNAKASFKYKESSGLNAGLPSRELAMRFQTLSSAFDILIEKIVSGPDDCIPIGVYSIENINPTDGIISITYAKGVEIHSAATGLLGSGTLEITDCDRIQKTVSGRFEAVLETGFGSTMVTITEGVFTDICLSE